MDSHTKGVASHILHSTLTAQGPKLVTTGITSLYRFGSCAKDTLLEIMLLLARNYNWLKCCLLVSLLTIHNTADAKKDKRTPVPTISPTSTPSTFPSQSPSLGPSSEPTKEPTTPLPTSSPSSGPTAGTTLSPTTDPTSQSTSAAPTTPPTSAPAAKASSNSPTITEVEVEVEVEVEDEVLNVRLPTLVIDLVLSDSDASSPVVGNLDTVLTPFIEDTLATNSGVDSFDYVSLEFDVIRSVFNRRRLETGLSVKLDGTAYYAAAAPSNEDLALNLRYYFSIWGIQELESYIQMTGLPSSRVASLSINGDTLKAADDQAVKNAGAQVQPSATESDPIVTPGIIVGLAVGSVVLILAIAFVIAQSRKAQDSSGWRRRQHGDIKSSERNSSYTGISPNHQEAGLPPSGGTSSDDESVGGISVDLSLYTTDASYVQPPHSSSANLSYDATRLDRVIAVAKQRSGGV